ncbi:SHOCT domain-containing protein [Halorarum halophilum]|uniref:SHOCT domain-containing protein n=1 Tax=Halorarum halophilum TaxID=2743090 RepID=A0A7D5GAD5_9EURY|nr:SHOCT domain-containing protein [Halobaculum halophilum]QLG26506.1 SHOCT domain-containing protein [Halobaculum halophilum]
MASQQQGDSFVRVVLVVLGVIVLFPVLMMVFAMPMMGMMGWWWGGNSSAMGLSPLWGIGMMLLFLAVLLGIGYLLYRGITNSRVHEYDRAIEELRTAYARGDLSDEEYEQRRQRLQRDRSS